jgi:uncharacterized membrane protein HdeD (DUF308 family)
MLRPYFYGDWRAMVVRAAAAVLFGFGALVWPGLTLWVLVLMWGAFAFVDGVAGLSVAILGRDIEGRGWLALYGAFGIAAGIVTFAWPSMTAFALLFVIAAWAFAIGILHISIAVANHNQMDHPWILGLTGLLSVGLALVLVVTPGSGALAITWAIGWYAILYGVLLFSLAWEVRRATKVVARASRHITPSAPQPTT